MIQQETCVQFTSDQFSVPFANLSCLKWLSHDHSVTGCTYINITELPFIFGCFFHFRFHMSTYEVDFHCQTVHVDIKLSGFSAPVVAAVSRDTWESYLSFAAKILLRLFHLSICDRQKSFKSRGNVVHAIQPSTCSLYNEYDGHPMDASHLYSYLYSWALRYHQHSRKFVFSTSFFFWHHSPETMPPDQLVPDYYKQQRAEWRLKMRL